MVTAFNRLSDEHKERVRHLLRRDEHTDLDIAREAERLHGAALWTSDAARQRAISRYRSGKQFRRWLERWETQDVELKRSVELQRQRFEFLSGLVKNAPDEGLYAASRHLQARLLTIAAEMSDEELKAGDVKWMRSLLREIREAEKLDRASLVDRLKEQIAELAAGGKAGEGVPIEKVVAKVDELMGLK